MSSSYSHKEVSLFPVLTSFENSNQVPKYLTNYSYKEKLGINTHLISKPTLKSNSKPYVGTVLCQVLSFQLDYQLIQIKYWLHLKDEKNWVQRS